MQPSITRKEIEEIIKPFENRFRNSTDGQKDTILELIGDSPENIELCKTIKYDQAKALITELYRIQEAYLEGTEDKEAISSHKQDEEHPDLYRYECALCHKGFNKPKKETPGSFIIEIFLWLFCLFPGIIYSLLRLIQQAKVCPHCGSRNFIKK